MSQFVYLEAITAASMFRICLHPDPRRRTLSRQQGGKRQFSCQESLWFRCIAHYLVRVLLCTAVEAQPSCTCCSQTFDALPAPSLGLYACMHLSGHGSIYITIRPSGLCTNAKSLRSHALRMRISGECRLTVLGTFAFMCFFFCFTSLPLFNSSL